MRSSAEFRGIFAECSQLEATLYGGTVASTESFGAMLRRLRTSAGLTQERLAERSGISTNGVAALEAGRRKTPRLNTVGLLCDALSVTDEQRTLLIAAATQTETTSPLTPFSEPFSERVPFSEQAPFSEPADAARVVRSESKPISGRGFIGRHHERQTLHDAWSRKTRVALLLGEAGVGKSTLAEQFATDLASNGVTVLRGRSTPEQLGVYEAFIGPVRGALGRYDGRVPTSLRDLARLVPGLLEDSGEALMPSRSDPAVERRLLFETVRTLFISIGPTLILLDDLHWADQGTLSLLAFLVAQPELSDVMIVGTIRSTDVTPKTSASLAELRRSCTVERLQLSGLTRPELTDLVVSVAGTAVSKELIDAVTTATNGNPLYIKELTEHLLQRGFDTTDKIRVVPDGIRDTIELRVAGLSKDAQALLRGGATLGETFDLRVAGELSSLAGEELLVAVEDALLSGLLVERTVNIAAFSHGLVATTVYESMSRSRRLVLHRGAATALAERDPTTSSEIVDVARHWAFVADADADPMARTTAAQWSVRAGDAAAASAAVDEAIACYQRAASYWDGSSDEHADTLVRLGSALASVGRLSEGNEYLQTALRLADENGDHRVFARAALALSASVRYMASDPQRIEELEAAIAKLGPSEMVLRPALLATLRRQLGFVETEAADRRRNEAAALVAEAVSAPDVSEELIMALGGLRDSLVVDDPVPLGELARKIIAVASARRDLPVLSTGWYRQAWSALELGQFEIFKRAVTEYRHIAEQLHRPYELALSSNMIAAVGQIEGRYVDAETAGQEALAHAATIDDGNFGWVYFANSGLRAVDSGMVTETLDLMKATRVEFAGLRTFDAALVAVAGAAGEHAMVRQLLDEQVGAHGEILDRDWVFLSAERLPVVGLLAWGCGFAGDAMYADILRVRLLRVAELGVRVVRIAPVGAWIGPIDHHIGVLCRIVGDLDDAQAHLERALEVEDEMNGHPFRVRTLLELATVADLRGGVAGSALANEWRHEAETLAQQLGLETLLTLRR